MTDCPIRSRHPPAGDLLSSRGCREGQPEGVAARRHTVAVDQSRQPSGPRQSQTAGCER
jgi:hypothetical protein